MATIQSTMTLNNKMSSTLSSITKAMHSTLSAMQSVSSGNDKMGNSFKKAQTDIINAEKNLKGFNQEIKKTKNNMDKGSNSSGSFFKSLLGASIVQKGIGMITNQLDNAINRFDTINNYQNVMAGLGFGAVESQASIARLKDGLDGLPTTLDDAVSSVQRFAAVNENIGASTEITLALNDALAAGGTPAQTQAAALEQISQAYAKGKFDAMEYKSMMNAMPAQLKQVAQAMGYTSTAVGGDFYTALQKGKIGMNDMMKTMVELDHKTGGFHDQAKNATNGIGTAVTNFKTAITKGIADMIEKINKSLKEAGFDGGIAQIISNIGKSIQRFLTKLGKIVGMIVEIIAPVLKWIQDNWSTIEPILFAAIAIIGYIAVATGIWTAAQWLLNSAIWACPITWIVLAIIAVIAIISALIGILNETRGATDETSEGFISATGVIMGILYTLVAFVYNNVLLPIYNGFADTVNFLANCFKNPVASIKILFMNMCVTVLDRIRALVQGIQDLINTIPGVEVNLTGGLNNLLSNVKGKIEAEKAGMGWEDVIERKSAWDYKAAASAGYAKGSSISSSLKKAGSTDTSALDALNGLKNNSNNVTGTDKSGSKALKTTTNDDLFSDDDIQLLMDIATRDYKLNYQQITPNVTLTFGDIHETADVDGILENVVTQLEEIYDGDLEVAK